MVSLKYELVTGDTIEIITSAHQKPGKDWLKHVKTGRARTKIRHYLMAQERRRQLKLVGILLNKSFVGGKST